MRLYRFLPLARTSAGRRGKERGAADDAALWPRVGARAHWQALNPRRCDVSNDNKIMEKAAPPRLPVMMFQPGGVLGLVRSFGPIMRAVILYIYLSLPS